jgi:hypothetical protein
MSSTALGIVLGILVGLRHAFEPDHLTAVSTLVGETHDVRHGALLGVLWGLGHTISLVVVGMILAFVGATLPPRAGTAFELGVAVMLVLLGARALAVALGGDHGHAHAPAVAGRRWRPFSAGCLPDVFQAVRAGTSIASFLYRSRRSGCAVAATTRRSKSPARSRLRPARALRRKPASARAIPRSKWSCRSMSARAMCAAPSTVRAWSKAQPSRYWTMS